MSPLVIMALLALTVVLPAVIALVVVWKLRIVCKPGELWVFAGRAPDVKILHRAGQSRMRIPIIEHVERLPALPIPFEGHVRDAYSKGNVTVSVRLVGKVKIATHSEELVRNAVERFLGRSSEDLARVAVETLQGVLREVIARHTPEQLANEPFVAQELLRSAQDDMDQLGLAPTDLVVERTDRNG